jgi:membrane protein implicated in regulation of membrane protease activity
MEEWVFLIFIGIGLVMILMELLMGLYTGLDLVFVGLAFVIGGLVSWPFHSWIIALVVTLVIALLYIFLGRKYVHRWSATKKEITNIHTIIGSRGTVTRDIDTNASGMVKVGNEEWRANATEKLTAGAVITVTGIRGVTLSVEKYKGGD